jgi:hypothetical protein
MTRLKKAATPARSNRTKYMPRRQSSPRRVTVHTLLIDRLALDRAIDRERE